MNVRGLKVYAEPSAEPVTTAEIKAQLAITTAVTTHDARIANLAKAARQAVEKRIRRTIINTTLDLYLDHFPRNPHCEYRKHHKAMELLRPPVSSVTSVTYINTAGVDTAFTHYVTDLVSLVPRIVPAYGYDWPYTQDIINAVKIRYVAGYGAAAANVPEPIRQAIIMLVIDLFEHPEANVEISLNENKSMGFLLNPYTVPIL